MKAWRGFRGGIWQEQVAVREFIQANYQPYLGDTSFLAGPTQRTQRIFEKVQDLLGEERERGGVWGIDTQRISSLLSYPPGYIEKEQEIIVGLQTDEPLKRGINPFGGVRMARQACQAYGAELGEEIKRIFEYRSTHNDGVFRVYTPQMRRLRQSGVITGLPDAYGRGRIIGDYRRVPLYGVSFLIAQKQKDQEAYGLRSMDEENIRLLEELHKQIDFLDKLVQMAQLYGYDITRPAENGREAVQWLYFAYLGAIKEQNGAAMSLGRVSTFLDVYFQRDLQEGAEEEEIQEIIDDLVLKLRLARQLRTPEYNQLFAGDPMWITEAIGGMGEDGRSLVSRTSYRMLQTLRNLGPAPEPNLTVLYAQGLPKEFKEFCAELSIETAALQYENDDLMRPLYGDDYAIACCVSAMRVGKEMQFFGARCNLPKLLLLALNGGRDELTGEQLGPEMDPVGGEFLEYGEVRERLDRYMDWLCGAYVQTMNVIHYMHDKYAYEKLQMALHDTQVGRYMAFGVAGLSVLVDSLSAIQYGRVRVIRDEVGLAREFEVGEYPQFGNDDDRVDGLACEILGQFTRSLGRHQTYRGAIPTLSVLTITSNVVYGQKTGATPCGRRGGEPFAPGANPMHGRERLGALAALNSVAKLPYEACRDGISCTLNLSPGSLGTEREGALVGILDGFFVQGGHHLNVNVLDRERLREAMVSPEKYPNLTIRVSGYAVNFHRLSPQQQEEVLARTFHEAL